MEIRDYILVVRRRWLTILAVVLVATAVAGLVNLSLTSRYTASTRLFFGVQGGESVTDLAQGSTFTEKQMSSYAQVATSPLVLNRVINELRLDTTAQELSESVSAVAEVDTVILLITATSSDPTEAALVANRMAEVMASVARDLSPERPDGSEAVRATTLAEAQVPVVASSPAVARNMGLAAAFGLLIGICLALLRHMLDTKVRSERDVILVTEGAVLGVIPFDSSTPDHPVVMHDDRLSARSEAVRRLRTNLQFVEVGNAIRSIVISSSISGEGKSTTCINLGVALADAGLKVLIIDADLRRPTVAEYMGFEGAVGLTTVLIGRASVEDVIQPWHDSSLSVLPSGQVPPNPSEMLGSKAMTSLLHGLTQIYDMVLLDSPPLLPVTDAAILSKVCDGTLVVIGADTVHKAQLRASVESLSTVGANVLGLVLNKVGRRQSDSYGYYYSQYDRASNPEDLHEEQKEQELQISQATLVR